MILPYCRTVVLLRRTVAVQFSTSSEAAATADDNSRGWMVRLRDAVLRYPNTESKLKPINLEIEKTGGHAVLGRNTSGKSLLLHALMDHQSYLQNSDSFEHNNDNVYRPLVERVSFESHSAALKRGGSVYKFLGGHLSPPVQFLVVRLGITGLLKRDMNHLSTGEIRKVILIRALGVIQPRILILDNAFDGLDVESRDILKQIVSTTIEGFKMDILIQGVAATSVPPIQILLATHRKEEIVDKLSRVTYMDNHNFITERRNQRSNAELMSLVHDEDEILEEPWGDWNLPSINDVRAVWRKENEVQAGSSSCLVKVDDFSLSKNNNKLISNLNWRIRSGERWLIAGGNGAGKSTLSRLLVRPPDADKAFMVALSARREIGWVSTERHMDMAHSQLSAMDVLLEEVEDDASDDLRDIVLEYFELKSLDRPFRRLSQGEQKLILIANSILKTPVLLIIDEPLQGLDPVNRRRVLGLVERICEATNVSLVYVTHHFEEVIPSVSHVLHLKGGRAVFNGKRAGYHPVKVKQDAER